MKWGLVPHWSKFEDSSLNTTNARAENLAEGGGMWASLRGSKRCVIPVQGYYEWLAKDKQKFPYFTKRKDGNVMLLAGLYDGATIEGEQKKGDLSLCFISLSARPYIVDIHYCHNRCQQRLFLATRPPTRHSLFHVCCPFVARHIVQILVSTAYPTHSAIQ